LLLDGSKRKRGSRLEKGCVVANKTPVLEDQDLGSLLANIARDSAQLLEQQIGLLRDEVKVELSRAGQGAAQIALGGGLTAAGGLLAGMTLAHAIQRATRLPLWACFGLVAGGIGGAGIRFLLSGKDALANVQLTPPPETTEALKENVQWLKHQLQPEKQSS
jgi:hypothetical protein